MRGFRALFAKEMHVYFASPLVYLVAAAFLAYTGYYFHSDLVYFLTFGFGVNIMENFWQLVFMDIRLVLILSVPLLTMRLLAEERRLGTLEVLVTYPLSDRAIVGAKLGACLVVVALLIAMTAFYPVWVYRVQPFDLTPIVAGYLGLFLLASACASYGLFVSALTESQVLAGFLTALPLLLLWLLSWNEAANADATVPFLRALSLFDHFQPFTVGIVEVRDVFYFLAIVGGFIWGTLRVLESRQWHGRR
jgi:ABC-2 type transport system permease protein